MYCCNVIQDTIYNYNVWFYRNTVTQNYCTGSNCDSVSSPLGEFFPLPPTPNSLDKLDNCFSDSESHCGSEEFLDETASELEAVKPDQRVEQVDTAKLNTQVLVKPTRSFDTQICSPSLPKRGSNTAMSSVFMMEPSLSRSEEHLWKKSKSTSAAVDRKHRYSSDALLEEDKRPPLPPRTYCLGQELPKIVSKPLPPIPIDEEEYIPNYERRRKLSSSMDCLRISEEEPSPYIAPIELYNQLKQEQSASLHLPDRPPLPAIPIEAPHRTGAGITRSITQYIPGKKYGHKRSRSSNCDFLKSPQKDEKPHIHQLNSYATLNPTAFRSHSMRAKSNSPPESDLENSYSLKTKNSFRTRSSKQSLVPDEADLDSFGTYTRMSPAPSIDVTSPPGQSDELLRDSYKLPTDNSSDTDLTECAAAVPPRRGERRKARRWETSKSKKNYNSASMHYWQQRQQPFEVPRYVSQPSVQSDSHIIPINIRHDTQSKHSSRDSNIYEHVDEDLLEGLRKDREDDYRSSAETDTVYRTIQQPGMFPHPPTAQEWHYFMYMWRLFLQWMTDHAPPEVYSVPSNVPANMSNTPPLAGNQAFAEYYDEVRKQSTTSYTSINCDWVRNLANAQTSSLVEDSGRASGGAFSPQEYSDSTEASTVVDKHSTLRSQNSHATLNGNGKSVSSFDSGICHNSHNDDSNSNGDS